MQFAKAAGAKVVATTGSNSKIQTLKDAGADFVINYKEDKEWGVTARNITGRADGFDHVVDVGGAGTLAQSAKAVASQGVISLVGFLSTEGDMPSLLQCLYGGFIGRGIGIGPREQFEEMVKAIEANDIMPHVDDKIFNFDQAKEAYQYLEDGKFFGKVVIKID
jgi:NADPH:quinone reductase-like Zn-dependent oxidoreductase